MHPKIVLQSKLKATDNLIIFISSTRKIPTDLFTTKEKTFIKEQRDKKIEMIPFNRYKHWVLVQFIPQEKDSNKRKELCRKAGDKIQAFLNEQKLKRSTLFDVESRCDESIALAEGMVLGSYQFLKYKTEKEGMHTLREIAVFSDCITKNTLTELNATLDGVAFTRDLVNEPNSFLTAPAFAREIEKKMKEAGIGIEVLNKKKIEALQMGGILGVNKGSHEPPVFIILEHKPDEAINKKPLILIGKGIVYDTGGMNLKTGNNMENMKTDMAGGAAVAGTLFTLARARLPYHVIGLIPATDNRSGPTAIVSGDVLRMENGMTVEVVNTDAEGRLILADALSYAKRYDPGLTIDMASLTGSAVRALGQKAMAGMQSNAKKEHQLLRDCGFKVFERIVELPLWDDYGEGLKSEVADIKNIGGPEAGAITAGKFLQRFTDYPFIHLDIAGPCFLDKRDSYRGQGGTGVGVRLIVEFIKKRIK